MQTHTAKITSASYEILEMLAQELGQTRTAIIERALESYRRQYLLDKFNQAYDSLKSDPDAWGKELAERKSWDVTLADGLKEG